METSKKRFRQAIAILTKKVNSTLTPTPKFSRSSVPKRGSRICRWLSQQRHIASSSRTRVSRAFQRVIMAAAFFYSIPIVPEKAFCRTSNPFRKNVKMAKLMFISYPHNPTGGCVRHKIFSNTSSNGLKGKNIIIAHDLTYSTLLHVNKAPSFLSDEGARFRH